MVLHSLFQVFKNWLKRISALTAYVWGAGPCSTLPTADENAVTESTVTTVSSSLFQSATVLTKNEFLYCSVLLSGNLQATRVSNFLSDDGDCSLNVYACGRQKALTMPAFCVAANCNNSQATQSVTMHEFPRNRPAMGRRWVQFVQFKRAGLVAASQSRPFV